MNTKDQVREPFAVNPADLSENFSGLVIRIGGNSITPRGSLTPDYEVLNGLLALTEYCATLGKTVIITCGAMGGHLFLQWARDVKCSDALVNELGCTLLDVGSQILADHFTRSLVPRNIACCPRPATSISDLLSLKSIFSVIMCGAAIRGAISSDSLAILVGEATGNPVLSVKRQLPFQASARPSGGRVDCTTQVQLSAIQDLINGDSLLEGAGWHHSLDIWALRLLRRPRIQLSFTDAESVKRFPITKALAAVMKVTK